MNDMPVNGPIHRIDQRLRGADGGVYIPQVSIEQQSDGACCAWLEFAAETGEALLLTSMESTQPDSAAVVAWARGLNTSDLQEALHEALTPFSISGAS